MMRGILCGHRFGFGCVQVGRGGHGLEVGALAEFVDPPGNRVHGANVFDFGVLLLGDHSCDAHVCLPDLSRHRGASIPTNRLSQHKGGNKPGRCGGHTRVGKWKLNAI